jgi:hypothetical protein
MANLITQPDNAVIDFTTISAIINAINTLQGEIDNINTANGKKATGSVTTVQSGHTAIASPNSSVKITFPTPFTANPTVVGTVLYGGGTPLYCYMHATPAKDSVTFNLNTKVPKNNAYIFWVAVGKV